MRRFPTPHVLVAVAAIALTAGCAGNGPTSPTAASPIAGAGSSPLASNAGSAMATTTSHNPHMQSGVPTGEHIVGKAAIEPAFNADTGEIMYLLTPEKAPLPSKANGMATSPLYLVEYPAGSTAAGTGHLDCEGLPGNCPDHDGLVAGFAVQNMPSVYGNGDPLGHDHVADPPGKPDFNVAWEVIEILFTDQGKNDGAINTRLTTDTAIMAAIQNGDAQPYDLGFAFNCSVVSPAVYWAGTPVS
jgi:hypothetical protein